MLKTYLLSLGCFIDNEYLDEYLSLIEQPFFCSNVDCIQKHHIIPRSYYNSDYSKTASFNDDISLKDPYNRLVSLTYSDHFYAHWLLYNCTISKLKSSNAKAIIAMSGRDDILNLPKSTILQICNEIKQDLDFYWSPEADAELAELYYANTPVEAIAEKLNRTRRAVAGRINRLSLSDRIWTSEEETWLRLNYKDLGKNDCACYLNRTVGAIEHKVTKLQISQRLWTDKDIEWLKANYTTTATAICAKSLNRSSSSVNSKAASLGLVKTTFWTAYEDTWLLENKPINTWQYCSEYLGRSIGSVKQRAFALKIPNQYHSQCSKAVRCVETNETFPTVNQACKKYGTGVRANLLGRYKTAKGLHFEYAE